MKRTILTLCVFFALLTTANAGEMYRCIDRDGDTIISNNPRDGMKCVLKGSYKDPSPQERLQEQRESQRISPQQEYQSEVQGRQEEAQRSQEREKQEYDTQQREKKATAAASTGPKGAIDVKTGQVYSPAEGGVVDPKTGTLHQDADGGYVNTKTGELRPQ